ncbi:PfkB family carbohydrate kinase [Saccharospirillum impatiens]|uniref:PfkB family carbohydrate kinase n=1 Tax=Saccharospirillum impatiens TaxID=169438 RepID=UPI0004059BF2|nr:PfkB family carbohydrate kinase [Saccharospirillum impatiens]
MTELEQQLVAAIRATPMATQQQLADQLGISRESVAGHIMRLTRQGVILGKGYLLPDQDRIVVLGGANVDLTGRCSASYRPGDSNPGSLAQSAGGVGRNIAENLAHLGHDVTLITLLGNDSNGDWLQQRIAAAGIRTDGLLRHPSLPTSTYLAMNDHDGQLIGALADMGITDALTPEALAPLRSTLVAADAVVVEANVPEATLAWLATLPLKGALYADAVSTAKAPRLKPLLAHLNVLKVNQSEARALLGQEDTDAEALSNRLISEGVKTVALSLGSNGLLLNTASNQHQQGIYPTHIASDTGAGDALIAGIIHADRAGWTLLHQAAFGLGCAGLTLESAGANHPQLTETKVNQWILDR